MLTKYNLQLSNSHAAQRSFGSSFTRCRLNCVSCEPAPGVWSAHEHAVHLPAIHPLINRRLDLMLQEPSPYIKGYEPSRDEPDDALLKLDLDAEMDRFNHDRAELVERIRKLTPQQWAITAEHEEYA